MTRKLMLFVGAVGLAVATRAVAPAGVEATAAAAAQTQKIPRFEWDPTWPKPFPNDKWAVGPMVGVGVDSHDHIWVIQRRTAILDNERYTAAMQNPPTAECCIPAPPILGFDQAGNLIGSFGAPGPGYEWPQREHGIFVDHKDRIWTAGNGDKDSAVVSFNHDGSFAMQIGHQGKSKGNADTENVLRAAAMAEDVAANELYVADGYGNKRIIVFDATNGGFKRMWGAYGNKPDDKPLGPYKPTDPPAQQFRTVHGVAISKDGLVYVADRSNDRVQVFRKDGTFVKEVFIAKHTIQAGSASGVAFSSDPQQQFLYVLDGANHRVWFLNRQTLQILGHFGRHGHWGGQLDVPHNMATDSKGNLYITETLEGRRVQRFLYKGLTTVSTN
jgi:DNA-binding beta-propeller fold protein YncE